LWNGPQLNPAAGWLRGAPPPEVGTPPPYGPGGAVGRPAALVVVLRITGGQPQLSSPQSATPSQSSSMPLKHSSAVSSWSARRKSVVVQVRLLWRSGSSVGDVMRATLNRIDSQWKRPAKGGGSVASSAVATSPGGMSPSVRATVFPPLSSVWGQVAPWKVAPGGRKSKTCTSRAASGPLSLPASRLYVTNASCWLASDGAVFPTDRSARSGPGGGTAVVAKRTSCQKATPGHCVLSRSSLISPMSAAPTKVEIAPPCHVSLPAAPTKIALAHGSALSKKRPSALTPGARRMITPGLQLANRQLLPPHCAKPCGLAVSNVNCTPSSTS
jgi:hypothetical protein